MQSCLKTLFLSFPFYRYKRDWFSLIQVASFTGEKKAITKYNNSLIKAYKSGVQEGLASGLGLGTVVLVVFCSYALAVWYGGKMILEKGYKAGEVMNVIFAVLTGSL
jgi:ATP-binding cassette subfamily B (MDR/TAP) protein 1